MWLQHRALVCVRRCVVEDSGRGLSLETRFGFGYTVRIWVFGLYVRESIANAGIRDSFGIVQLSGKPGEKRKYCEISRKELEARRWEIVFPFSWPGVLTGEGGTHME